MTLLCVQDLHIGFSSDGRKSDAVKKISFEIAAGEVLGIVGESGSGKSVTATAILQLLPPNAYHESGQIRFGDTDLMTASETEMQSIRGRDIAMVFQEPMSALNPLHTIEKQIAEIITQHRSGTAETLQQEVIALLARVGIPQPEKRLSAYPHELSGGQRQRVTIAMAIANKPKLLIADEPTTALDVTVQWQILDLLKKLQAEENMAMLLISHDLGMVKYMADRICVMRHGEIVESNHANRLFAAPQADYTKQLIAAEPEGLRPPYAQMAAPFLSAKNMRVWFPLQKGVLRRTYDHIKAVNDIDLEVRKGETLGIVGESGSGKTTLGRALLGLQESTGEVEIAGRDMQNLSRKEWRGLRRNMQIVFQDPFGSLSPRMSVFDIITEGLDIHAAQLTRAEKQARVRQALLDVEMDPDTALRYPHEFSGGQRQRIAIARAIILAPELVVLDEPTSALDRSVQAQVLDLLIRLQEQRQLTYLFISHDLKVVRAIAHRVIVMQNGHCVEAGATEDIFYGPQQDYTKNLISAAFD